MLSSGDVSGVDVGLPGYDTVTGRVQLVRCSDRDLLPAPGGAAGRHAYLTVYRGSCDHFAVLTPADTVRSLAVQAGGPARPCAIINLRACRTCLQDAAGPTPPPPRDTRRIHISSINKEHLDFVIQVLDKDVDMLLDALQGDAPLDAAGVSPALVAPLGSGAVRRYSSSCRLQHQSGSIETIVEEDEEGAAELVSEL